VYRQHTDLILEVISDETARRLFAHISEGPKSAKDLQDSCSASLKTVYRRLEKLQEAGLISPVDRVDVDGTHYTLYGTNVTELDISVNPDAANVEIEIHEDDSVDQFVSAWQELQK
jgi:predicted transcriptional regulator